MAHHLSFRMLFGVLALVALGNRLAAGADCTKRPPRVDPLTCCPIPNIITEEIMEKCKMSMPPPPPPPSSSHSPEALSSEMPMSSDESRPPHPPGPPHHRHHHHHHHRGPHGPPMHPCFMACVLNETGIMMAGPDAKLNEDKLSAYLKVALVNATDMIPVMESSFKTCAAKGEEILSKIREKMQKKHSSSSADSDSSISQDRMMRPPRHRCSPSGGYLMGCVFKESLKNCPASLWSNTAECNEMRDHLKNCKPPKFNDKPETANSLEEM